MVIFLRVHLILIASLGSTKDEDCSFILERDNTAKLQAREIFLGHVRASPGKSLGSPPGGPPTMVCRHTFSDKRHRAGPSAASPGSSYL